MSGNQDTVFRSGGIALSLILQISLVALGTAFLLDAAIFRNPVYKRWLEPESAAGSLDLAIDSAAHTALSARNRVLLFGDSQMTEGFSAKLARQTVGPEWQFVNAAVPGSTPRTWYYMLREIDPNKDRFTVVALPLPDYDDVDVPITYGGDHWDNDSDRELDAHWLAGELSLKDVSTFPWTFHSPTRKLRMFVSTLFKGTLLRQDFRDFLEHPSARIAKARTFAMHHAEWAYEYAGSPESLEGMRVSWSPLRISFPSSVSPSVAEDVRDVYRRKPEALGHMTEYRKRWLGGILDYYRGRPVRVVLFRVPQRPIPVRYHWGRPLDLFVRHAEKTANAIVLDQHLFDDLEQPADYRDGNHLNRQGRQEFSRRLATEISEAVLSTTHPGS
jgi:hypothetical protein